MNKFWGTIKRFKFKSAFVQFYLNILLVAFTVSVLFSVFIYKTYIHNFSESRSMANSALLTQAVGEMDNSVGQLYASVLSITKDPIVAKAIVVPSYEDQTGNSDIVQRLNNASANFDYINKIYLYESTTGLLFTSDKYVGRKDESKHQRLIDTCLTAQGRFLDSSYRQNGLLLSSGGRLYMVCNFIPNSWKFIGTMICEINSEKLFSVLNETTRDTDYLVFIEDADHTHLFSSDLTADHKAALQLTMISDYTGWLFELYSSSTVDYSLLSYVRSIFPMLLFVLLASILISFYVTTGIYSPVGRLLSLIENGSSAGLSEEDAESGSSSFAAPVKTRTREFEILARTYTQLSEDNRITESFLNEVRPDLESRLLLDIISKRSGISESSVSSQISIMSSRLSMKSRFQCFFMQLSPTENNEQLLYYMMFKQIQQKISGMIRDDLCHLYFLFYNEETFSFLVQYGDNRGAEEIAQIRTALIAAFRQQFSEISEKITTASGSLRDDLMEIGISYHEAREELKKQIYYGSEKFSGSGQFQFRESLDRVQKLLDEGCIEEAEQLIFQFLKELCGSSDKPVESADGSGTGDLKLIKGCCSGLTDILIERLSVSASSGNPEDHAGYQNIYAVLDTMSEKEDIFSFMNAQTSDLIHRLKQEYNRSQRKLIEGAKEYIRLHYSDSNLTVSQIADSIGITDTYLSSIFSEYTGENLVTFLNRYRVDMAKELLLNTQIIIRDIGFKTGFYTVQNFNRVFKRFEGMTPGEFRKQNFRN